MSHAHNKEFMFQLQFPKADCWEQHSSYRETGTVLEVGCTHSGEHHPGYLLPSPATLQRQTSQSGCQMHLNLVPSPKPGTCVLGMLMGDREGTGQ